MNTFNYKKSVQALNYMRVLKLQKFPNSIK